jgi:hypothetical protein
MRNCPEKFLRIWRTAAPGCPGTGSKACATESEFLVFSTRFFFKLVDLPME